MERRTRVVEDVIVAGTLRVAPSGEIVLHQEKGSKTLLAEFPNKAFELIPTVFNALETCVFSVSSKR